MPQTIRDPLSWSVATLREAGRYFGAVADQIGGVSTAATDAGPQIRRLEAQDLAAALRRGFDDFTHFRSDAVFLVVVYPLIGIGLVALTLERNVLPLVFPVIYGFTLVGPVAAVGLYEMSRRREAGIEGGWGSALSVLNRPTFGAIFLLGCLLLAIFGVWIAAAQGIYHAAFGPYPPATLGEFVGNVFGTAAGWAMILIGLLVGALFALLVLSISVVSFPCLLDRNASLATAILTSVRVVALNPAPMLTWGLIVIGSILLASLPVFLGLIVVFPVLGHATWHLYRRAVVAEDSPPMV